MSARSTTGVLAVALVALALTACGDGSGGDPKAPQIPAAVADRLAGLSDETAAALELGDDCAAQEVADELEREAQQVESQIPAELREQVREGVRRLTTSISCQPAPVIETGPEDVATGDDESSCPPGREKKDEHGDDDDDRDHGPGDRGKGKSKDKDKDRCEGRDEDDEDDEGHGPGGWDDGGGGD